MTDHLRDELARAHVRARAQGLDEITGQPCKGIHNLGEFSHRIAAGRGGTVRPANGLRLHQNTHAWLTGHPALAYKGGWHVETGATIQETPVWLSVPWQGWWLIEDRPDQIGDGGPHLLIPLYDHGIRPQLPFESTPDYEAWKDSHGRRSQLLAS